VEDPLALFAEPVGAWFRASLGAPTKAQALGWPSIVRGESTLLLAPTGSGKTLAAFLAAIDKLTRSPEPPAKERCTVLYVSPLKALAVDVERNLRAPLAGVVAAAHAAGETPRIPTVLVRTGDTPAADRARMLRHPPDILITTPESLYLLLTSGAQVTLGSIDTVIIDEIHSLVATKRGAHLFLSLERLEELRQARIAKESETDHTRARTRLPTLQRIGLSATQRPLDEVARLLGGFHADGKQRPVTVVDAGERKQIELTIEVPDIDLGALGQGGGGGGGPSALAGGDGDEDLFFDLDELPSGPAAGGMEKKDASIWPHLHQRLVALVKEHRSTMIFVNSRRLSERLAAALNEVAGDEIALAHHGSVAREKRQVIEERLKSGDLPAIIATSSLELGIDMGAVDLVVQIEAPPSVASGLQRIGRASHQVGGVPSGIIFPKHRADLLAAATASASMVAGDVESTFYPRNPLDVLAQQIVAMVSGATTALDVEALYETIRRAAPFAELPRGAYESVLDMLSGRYPSDEFSELKPRITWDRARGKLTARQGAQRLAVVNGGTIPDRGLYGVFLVGDGRDGGHGDGKTSRRVGELDEEMVFELRVGEVFLLGASSWRAEEITHEKVLVTPAPGEPGKMPFWHGDRPGRPRGFGAQIGALTRKVADALKKNKVAEAVELLEGPHALGEFAVRNLLSYIQGELDAVGEVPTDRHFIVERYPDELGDSRVCVLSPFGSRVHAPWATAVAARLRAHYPGNIETIWNDDGMVFRLPASDEPPDAALFFPPSEEIEAEVTRELAGTSLFAARFREAAGRALLLPRKYPGKRTPLWAQRKRSSDLLAVASRHPSFPIVLETYRECLRDVFDLPGLVELLRAVEQRKMRVITRDVKTASPFAASLSFSFVANFIYDGDAPLAERRAQALTVDHAQLRELLGEAELRQLLDAEAMEEHERQLQRLTFPAKHADGLHDLLLHVGDLTPAEVRARVTPEIDAAALVDELVRARRIFAVRIRGEERVLAAEDVGRYRDALGLVPPRGVAQAFLDPRPDALDELVARYGRTHGPFTVDEVARRYGLGAPIVEGAVDRLVRSGKLVDGSFRPHGTGRELCDAEVLRVLRRKSLARLRAEVEPVDAAAFARFTAAWQQIGRRRSGPEALLEAIGRLEGCPLPASELNEIFASRLDGFRPSDLDLLSASGEIVWGGLEPLGDTDGRVALYLAEHEEALARPVALLGADDTREVHTKLRALLEQRGAVFFADMVRVIGGYPAEILTALWDLVWAGEVTNDTLEPLRSRLHGGGATARPHRSGAPTARSWRSGPPGSEGRWSLRASRRSGTATATERSAALARSLLDRYGVVTREVAHAEGIEGGFSAVYDVLKAMEEAGRARRGYFVAGRGATQFAWPGAEDRLRSAREIDPDDPDVGQAMVLAATDPANPYGGTLPWPEREGARPMRAAGARVVLHEGALVAYLGRSEETLTTFLPENEPERGRAVQGIARALGALVDGGRRKLLALRTLDGDDAARSPLADTFVAAGFFRNGDALLRRRAPSSFAGAGGATGATGQGPRGASPRPRFALSR
jgi:ATP-dependent Lhr-like helicase